MRGIWIFLAFLAFATAFPEQGKFELRLNTTKTFNGVAKNVFKGTKLILKVHCNSDEGDQNVTIGWILRETQCWNEFAFLQSQKDVLPTYYQKPGLPFGIDDSSDNESDEGGARYVRMIEETYKCEDTIYLSNVKIVDSQETTDDTQKNAKENSTKTVQTDSGPKTEQVQYVVEQDGDYLFVVHIEGSAKNSFQAIVEVKLEGNHGYLSVVDWPLLPFYGVMCGVYVCMGIGWLIVCAKHFTELLRIQFWIGGVIFLGMLEKAMFYAEFQNINSNGVSAKGLIFSAEVVSCAKRTLARMLVIIVSLGFGIVKPRLGPTLHRVIGVGGLYFALATTEAYIRVTRPKNDISTSSMLAGIPLAVMDSAICWWIFSGLTQTLRTLRLRRNLVKFKLYRNFTNVLIFDVISSVVFMMVNIKLFKLSGCLKDWKELWVDEAFWHLMFSILLACIMILWTPSNNNKRYAFQPLLDNDEDDSDDEEFNAFLPDVYEGMKHRMNVMTSNGKPEPKDKGTNPEEDPLKWVEENIPETVDNENPLPVLDSEEELETTRFELSKMQ